MSSANDTARLGVRLSPIRWGRRLWADRRFRFLFVGGVNTVFSFAVYSLATLLGAPATVATGVSLVLTIVLSFVLNKQVAFKQRGVSARQVALFLGVYGVSYVINNLMLWWLVEGMGLNRYVSQLICMPVYAVISYLGHSRISFK